MSKKIGAKKLLRQAAVRILEADLPGMTAACRVELDKIATGELEIEGYQLVYAKWERAWGVEASLHVALEVGGKRYLRGGESALEISPNVTVSWPSTGKRLAQARATVRLMQDVVDLGCEVEAMMSDYEIVKD